MVLAQVALMDACVCMLTTENAGVSCLLTATSCAIAIAVAAQAA
jgi:hypothetical protein